MKKKYFNIFGVVLFIISSFIIIFNIYYFFIRQNVRYNNYLYQLLNRPSDKILSLETYQDLVEEYKCLNNKYGENLVIVFAGDSIIKRFNTEEFIHEVNVLNRGIYFDTTYGLLNRLNSNINNVNIDKLFIMIGYNDLGYRSNNEIVDNIRKIVRISKANKKYIQSVLPVHSAKKGENNRIDSINHILKENAKKDNYIYIDINSIFKDSQGGINIKLSRDGIHPNYYGYQLWYSIIKEYL